MKFHKETRDELIALQKKGVFLEGNILKVLEPEDGDESYNKYLADSKKQDEETRKKRLEITKQVQLQNNELKEWKAKNEKTQNALKTALEKAEKAKKVAINDLEFLQKKSQYELVNSIVKVSLWIVGAIGLMTTALFMFSLIYKLENKIIETTWTNIIGILLTNSFSIIGTIMGVKYANGNSANKEKLQAEISQPHEKCEICNK